MRLMEELDKLESQARSIEYLIDDLRETLYLYGLWNEAGARYDAMTKTGVKGAELKEMSYIMDGYMHNYQRKERILASDLVKAQTAGVDLMGIFYRELEARNKAYKDAEAEAAQS